jgi:hypothetical protein
MGASDHKPFIGVRTVNHTFQAVSRRGMMFGARS